MLESRQNGTETVVPVLDLLVITVVLARNRTFYARTDLSWASALRRGLL
jgi:hypothetical protein